MNEKWQALSSTSKLVVIAVVAIVTARVFLPLGLKLGANYFLENKLEHYEGRIEDIDLAIYRGAYEVKDIKVWKKFKTAKDPMLSIKKVKFSLNWKPLFNGKVVGDVIIDKAVLEIILSEKEEKKQVATEKLLRQWADKIIPVKMESIQILDCRVTVKNSDFRGSPQFSLDNIYVTAINLTNVNESKELLPSTISAQARVQESSIIKSEIKANLTRTPPLLDANIRMNKFDLTKVNPFLLAYKMMTFNKGYFSLYSEFNVKNNQIKGYIKPFFEDIDVISKKEKFGTAKRALLEIGTALGNLILRNKDNKTVATKIEFEGAVDSPDVEKGGAFWTSIHNAFINALKKGLENSISFKNVSAVQE